MKAIIQEGPTSAYQDIPTAFQNICIRNYSQSLLNNRNRIRWKSLSRFHLLFQPQNVKLLNWYNRFNILLTKNTITLHRMNFGISYKYKVWYSLWIIRVQIKNLRLYKKMTWIIHGELFTVSQESWLKIRSSPKSIYHY